LAALTTKPQHPLSAISDGLHILSALW